MKDLLKDFINKNRKALDAREPSSQAWDRIAESLPAMTQVSIWNSVIVWRAAAILFMTLSIFLYSNKPATENKEQSNLLRNEFSAIESYYSDEIAYKVARIDHIEGGFGKDQFTQAFQKLDAMYQVLRDEMKLNPSEKVKDVLILNILVRIDLLNRQIKKLEEKKEKKDEASASV